MQTNLLSGVRAFLFAAVGRQGGGAMVQEVTIANHTLHWSKPDPHTIAMAKIIICLDYT